MDQELATWLQRTVSRDTQRVQVLAKQGQGKHVTIEVIQKLQQQAEAIQRQVDVREGLPLSAKWQYFLEGTPVGFRGQYSNGRSIIELLLTPDGRSKNDILNRIGPLNVALGFDLF